MPTSPKRKVIVSLGISLDGYIARPNGGVDFLFIPKDFNMGEFIATCDVNIMGRKTLDVSLAMGGSFEGGDPSRNFVYSRTKPAGVSGGLTYTRKKPVDLVASIRKEKGKNIWLMGGGEIVRQFLQADLVDELMLGIVPTLIGGGIPLFPKGFPERKFALIEAKTYSKGLVVLRYKRSGARR